jgi:hypothetical protein
MARRRAFACGSNPTSASNAARRRTNLSRKTA